MLPNPFRQAACFDGRMVYAIPSGEDVFELVVGQAFGAKILVVCGYRPPGQRRVVRLILKPRKE